MPSIRRYPAPLRDRADGGERDKWADWTVTFLNLDLPIGPVKDLESAREYWGQFGEEITAEWIKTSPGTRPPAWWEWSAPGPYPDNEDQAAFLAEHDILTPEESEVLDLPTGG